MVRRKRRYYDTYTAIKNCQPVTNLDSTKVNNWIIKDAFLDIKDDLVNKRQRSRVGHVEQRKKQ